MSQLASPPPGPICTGTSYVSTMTGVDKDNAYITTDMTFTFPIQSLHIVLRLSWPHFTFICTLKLNYSISTNEALPLCQTGGSWAGMYISTEQWWRQTDTRSCFSGFWGEFAWHKHVGCQWWLPQNRPCTSHLDPCAHHRLIKVCINLDVSRPWLMSPLVISLPISTYNAASM